MSTLTRTNSRNKTLYKDYVSFLGSYRDNKSVERNNSVASDMSSNNAFTDEIDVASLDRKHYSKIENGTHHHLTKNRETKQIVKTEMYIEIKQPSPQFPIQKFEVSKVNVHDIGATEPSQKSVSNVAKVFEKNDQSDLKFNNKVKLNKTKSVGEMTKKYEMHSNEANSETDLKYPRIPTNEQKSQSISKSQHNFNTIPKPFQPLKNVSTARVEIKTSPPKPTISSKPSNILNAIPNPPKSPQNPSASSAFSTPTSASPSRVVHQGIISCAAPPPPPPLPPYQTHNSESRSQNINSISTSQHVKKDGQKQSNEIVTNGTINKNDPRVKKAVYGALRNMYGAYHDQANDYLATLPKNRVRKNNGLDTIIDSIASQGGLEKLSGRANPKTE